MRTVKRMSFTMMGFLFILCNGITLTASKQPMRPDVVTRSINNNEPLYYFGLGSNMLRSKLENRGVNGSKIELLDFEPAKVKDHRLSFNLRGFPPLEPGMGSLEPVDSDSEALLTYSSPECHGALAKLSPENYVKVMASEGVSDSNKNPGYEEVVVTAIPYDKNKPPVQAIALRARKHCRLRKDASPSVRYMKILREGAAELGLEKAYQEFLVQHPVQQVPRVIKHLAGNNVVATFVISKLLRWRGLSWLQSRLLFSVYVNSRRLYFLRVLSNIATALILLPGACLGYLIRLVYKLSGKKLSPFLKIFLDQKTAEEE